MANISENPNIRGSVPTFQLTNTVNIPLILKVGQWVKGKWIEDTEGDPVIFEGNVQPLRYHEILQMPEADRTREWIKIYTTAHVRTSQEPDEDGYVADRIEWDGKTFKVMNTQRYVMGILNHTKILAAREPVSAGY